MNLSVFLRDYLKNFQKDYDYQHRGIIDSFEIDDLALSVGKFYEKIRKVIDWKEENALRRGAIARAIKRNLVTQIYGLNHDISSKKVFELAESMVFELMRSGYFNNKLINAQKVDTVGRILNKYVVILQDLNRNRADLSRKDLRIKIKLQSWVIQIAACEIEECLAPSFKTVALVKLMSQVLKDRIKVVPASNLSEAEIDKMILIAVWRSLFEADDDFISYELLKLYINDFFDPNKTWELEAAQNVFKVKTLINKDLNTKIGRQFLRIANKYDAAYRLIGEIAKKEKIESIEQGEKFFTDQEKIKAFFAEIYQSRYKSLKKRLLKTAFWTTLSIIVTNIASILILEWPVAMLAGLEFSQFAIFMDVFIPSLAMFGLVIIIRPPKKANEAVVWKEIEKIIYQTNERDIYEVRQLSRTKNKALQTFFLLSTLLAGAAGLYGLYLIFDLVGLPWTSIYINIVYITMVLFASLNIREKSQEITIFEESNLFDFILDIFSIPLARIGQWFAKKWKEYNIFSIIFSILIDAPLSMFIGFLEDWRNFLKEKKSEIR